MERLQLVFKDKATYEAAKRFFDTESAFFANETLDEWRTLVFEESNDVCGLEAEISKELEDNDFTGYHFEIE